MIVYSIRLNDYMGVYSTPQKAFDAIDELFGGNTFDIFDYTGDNEVWDIVLHGETLGCVVKIGLDDALETV